MIKYDIILGLFFYPFLCFLLIKKSNFIKNFFLFIIIGFLYFYILYFFGFGKLGFEVFLKGTVLSAIVFSFSGSISSYIYHKYFTQKYYIHYFIFPILFLLIKYICFQTLFGASYLLEVSIVFSGILSYINLTWQHFIIFLSSIIFFDNIYRKNYKISFLIFMVILTLFFFNFYINNKKVNYNESKKVKFAMIQHNNFDTQNNQKVLTQESQLQYVINHTTEVAHSGAKIIIWPESTFFNIGVDKFKNFKLELEKLSKQLDIVLVYGAVWIDGDDIENYKNNFLRKKEVYSSVFVIDPDKGYLETYNAQELYPRPNKYLFKKGKKGIVFETKYGNFFVLICFESLIRKIPQSYSSYKDDIDYMIVISNNKFLGKSKVLDTLLWNYTVESSSLQLPLLSSTNTGPTTYFSNTGQMLDKLDYNFKGILYGDIYLK